MTPTSLQADFEQAGTNELWT